jgi:hypothetical protein
MMDECAGGFAGHLSRLFYWPKGCIGSDDRLVRTIGIPNGRVFLSKYKGFLLEQRSWIAESGSSVDFCAKGQLFSRVRLKIVPECIQGKNKNHGCKCEANS